MSHLRALRAAVPLLSVLAACAVPADTEPEPGQAEEAVERQVVPLPYSATIGFHQLTDRGPFKLPKGIKLTVRMNVYMLGSHCPVAPFWVTPSRKRLLGSYTDALETRRFKADGITHWETWTTSDAGLYLVYIDPQTSLSPGCYIAGTITVTTS